MNRSIISPTDYLLQVVLVAAVSSWLCMPLYSAELFGDLALGRWILAHNALPTLNLWTEVGLGACWLSSSWLFQALAAFFELKFGLEGVVLLKALFVFGFTLAVAFVLSRRSGSAFFGTFLAICVAAGALTPNPFGAEFSALLFSIVLLNRAIRHLEESGAFASWVITALLSVVVMNLFLGSLWALVAGAVMVLLDKRFEWRKRRSVALGLFGCLLLGVFLNPYFGMHVLGTFQQWYAGLELDLMYQLTPGTLYHYPVAFLILLWVIYLIFWRRKPQAVQHGELLVSLVATLLALISLRFTPYALVFVAFALGQVWGRAEPEDLGGVAVGLRKLSQSLNWIPRLGLVWLFLCVAIVFVYKLYKDPVAETVTPKVAIDYIAKNQLPGPYFHEAEYGSHMLYWWTNREGVLEQMISIDSRVGYFDPELREASALMTRARPGWERLVERLRPRTAFCRNASALCQMLSESRDWDRVFDSKSLKPTGTQAKEDRVDWSVFSSGASGALQEG